MSTSLGDPAVASPSGSAETDATGTLHPLTSVADRAATPRGAVTTPRPGSPALAGWVRTLRHPQPEGLWSRASARLGGLVSVLAILAYLTWRAASTLPAGTAARAAAYTLIAFEGLPILALLIRIVTLWNIDCRAPEPVSGRRTGTRVAVLIPTYNEPVEVIAPTIAAACALQPHHETWVLDDGDRQWVEELCAQYGARYVSRPVHDHAKAGNLNHAFKLMARESAETGEDVEVVAVLDCDHVPLPHFLTATLGWFDDPDVALVQGPQAYYNAGAFDDDGVTGEQGIFFNVLMPARNHDGAGPFWCGSTSLLRLAALRQAGGIATETIVEDMHTTLRLIRRGWKTVFHHQTLAVGLAPATAEQYLLQRRRWGMGAMQVLTRERLWAAKRWMSWRNFYEYLTGTLWWLEGVATLGVFLVPATLLVSGVQTTTASVSAFATVFGATFYARMWGALRLYRGHLHLPTALALRVFRIPIGLSCLWWLLTRRTLEFEVTPKAGADERHHGRVPRILWVLLAAVLGLLGYAAAGLAGLVPWRSGPTSSVASGVWLVVAAAVLALGTARIRAAEFATSRRNAYRVTVAAPVAVDGVDGELVDVSVGGAAVRLPATGSAVPDRVTLVLPKAAPVRMEVIRVREPDGDAERTLFLRVPPGDWAAHRILSLWMFHTPEEAVPGLPAGVPAVAVSAG